jgi:hypothetical protein
MKLDEKSRVPSARTGQSRTRDLLSTAERVGVIALGTFLLGYLSTFLPYNYFCFVSVPAN